jgi:hypothetical protein
MGLPLCACTAFLAPSSALAASSHPFLETFGAAEQPSFSQAQGIAVDQSTGDLLVIDGEANTVSRWHGDGTPANFSALATNTIDAGEGPGAKPCAEEPASCDLNKEHPGLSFGGVAEVEIAVDDSATATDGDIYVPQAGTQIVDIFASTGEFVGQLSEYQEGLETKTFTEPCGIAVDPSGNVYVGDFSGHIHKYQPAANPPVNADNTANFAFSSNCTLAAGEGPTAGSIFAAHYFGAVVKLDGTTGEEGYVVNPGAETTTVSVDPANGHVLTAQASAIAEFDAAGSSGASELSSTPLEAFAQGVAANGSTGELYATHEGAAHVQVFGPLVSLTVKKGSGAGEGTVQSTPAGIACGPACPQETAGFSPGEVVELTATPASNSEFTGWSTAAGNPGTCTGTTSPCEVTLGEAAELEADFALLPAPAVSALSVTAGSTGGGNVLEITGTNLAKATKVQFGATVVNAPFSKDSATSIELAVPAHAQGTVDVTVTTGGGDSPNTPADRYTFIAPPAVTALAPSSGPTAGANILEIKGLRLAGATKVEIGTAVVSAPFIEDSATAIRLSVPAHAAGRVKVRVSTPGGTSADFPVDEYTYEAPVPVLPVTEIPAGPGTPTFTVSTPPPPPPSNRVKLGAAAQHGESISLPATVTAAGRLTVTGRGIRTATATLTRAGTTTLRLTLTAAARKQLKKKGKLKVRVTITFAPTGGTAGTSTQTVIFKARRKGK